MPIMWDIYDIMDRMIDTLCVSIFLQFPGSFLGIIDMKKNHPFAVNTLLEPSSQKTAREIMSTSNPIQGDQNEALLDDTVLIVGGGPVGLLVASVLAFYGVKSLLLERNKTTTK